MILSNDFKKMNRITNKLYAAFIQERKLNTFKRTEHIENIKFKLHNFRLF